MNILKALYRDFFKTDASVVAPIAGSGSARRYYRLVSEAGSAIGVAGVDAYENATFIYLAEYCADMVLVYRRFMPSARTVWLIFSRIWVMRLCFPY